MLSKRNGGAFAVIGITVLLLAVAPASAIPREPALPVQAEEEGLLAQAWLWITSLFGIAADGAGEEMNGAGACGPGQGQRGCAIDPNG